MVFHDTSRLCTVMSICESKPLPSPLQQQQQQKQKQPLQPLQPTSPLLTTPGRFFIVVFCCPISECKWHCHFRTSHWVWMSLVLPSRKRTWLAGESTMNESMYFPIEHGYFSNVLVVLVLCIAFTYWTWGIFQPVMWSFSGTVYLKDPKKDDGLGPPIHHGLPSGNQT